MLIFSGETEQLQSLIETWDKDLSKERPELDDIVNNQGMEQWLSQYLMTKQYLPDYHFKVHLICSLLRRETETSHKIIDAIEHDCVETCEEAKGIINDLCKAYRQNGFPDNYNEAYVLRNVFGSQAKEDNKQFAILLGFLNGIRFETIQTFILKMNREIAFDYYDKNDYLAALTMRCQGDKRYATYQALLRDYDKIPATKEPQMQKKVLENVAKHGTVALANVKLQSRMIYSRGIDPLIKNAIGWQKFVIKERNEERTVEAVYEGLKRKISERLSRFDENDKVRFLRGGYHKVDCYLAMLVDPEKFKGLKKGTEFVFNAGEEEVKFSLKKKIQPLKRLDTDNGQPRKIQQKVTAYVHSQSDNVLFPANSLMIKDNLPEGVISIYNQKDITRDQYVFLCYYDPNEFEGTEGFAFKAKAEAKSLGSFRFAGDPIEKPKTYTYYVEVVGGEGAIEIELAKGSRSKNWDGSEVGLENIQVVDRISKKKDGRIDGVISGTSNHPITIRKGAMLSFRDTDNKWYVYRAKENVSSAVVEFTASCCDETEKSVAISMELNPVENVNGVIGVRAKESYCAKVSEFGQFCQNVFGMLPEKEFPYDPSCIPDLPEWFMDAEPAEGFEKKKDVRRNDIATLAFLDYTLSDEANGDNRFKVFEKKVNQALAKCRMNKLYYVNPYEHLLAYLVLHTHGEDTLNAFQLLWMKARRQGVEKYGNNKVYR